MLVPPIKVHFSALAGRFNWLDIDEPFQGNNKSRQYNARLAYRSAVTGEREFIKVEVSFREEIILARTPELLPARTLLRDPGLTTPALPPVNVRVLHLHEAYAERIPGLC